MKLAIAVVAMAGMFGASSLLLVPVAQETPVKVSMMEVDGRKTSKVYTDPNLAIKETTANGRPLVIVLSGSFCSWCEKQKQELKTARDPAFDYCVIDRQHTMFHKLRIPGGIPQLHIITKSDKVFKKNGRKQTGRIGVTSVGYKSVEAIKKQIKEQQAPSKKDK